MRENDTHGDYPKYVEVSVFPKLFASKKNYRMMMIAGAQHEMWWQVDLRDSIPEDRADFLIKKLIAKE